MGYLILLFLIPLVASWETVSKMPFFLNDSSIAKLNGNVYLLGGELYNVSMTKLLSEYNPIKNHWNQKESMPFIRNYYSITTTEDSFYVIGGMNQEDDIIKVYGNVERFDGTKWHGVAKLNYPRYNSWTIYFLGKIYVIGGCFLDGGNFVSNIVCYYTDNQFLPTEIYDSKTNSWEINYDIKLNPLIDSSNSYKTNLFTKGSYVYVPFVKYSETGSLMCIATIDNFTTYDEKCKKLNFPLAHITTLMVNNCILFMGGNDGIDFDDVYSNVYSYNVETHDWNIDESMNIPRANSLAEYVNDRVYIFGGDGYEGKLRDVSVG